MSAKMGQGKKPIAYADPASRWLMKLSKAAMVDCVIDLLRANQENCDAEVSAADALERLRPILIMRGDRIPSP